MISDAELKRTASDWGVNPMIVDLDYVLGAFLSQWYLDDWTAKLRFKGGTCLRKCYFPRHRFSEDLDFTAEEEIDHNDLIALLERTEEKVQDVLGVDLRVRPRRMRILQDPQGGTTLEIRMYYRGPLFRTGSPQAIQLHITEAGCEFLAPVSNSLDIIHPYTDQALIAGVQANCYTLQEIISEKLRAISGQRRFTISRDLYDIYHLLNFGGVVLDDLRDLMEPKFRARGLKLEDINPVDFIGRREEFERDWARNLQHLLPSSDETRFNDVWSTSLGAVEWVDSIS